MIDSTNDFVSEGFVADGPVRPYLGPQRTPQIAANGESVLSAVEASQQETQHQARQETANSSAKESGKVDAAKGGRPRVLDEKKRAEICAQLAAGCTFTTAARYVGCTAAAISMLLKRDEEFRVQVDRALALREINPLAHIRAAMPRAWKAAAWMLERTVKGTYMPGNLSDPADIGRAVDKEVQAEVIGWIADSDARTYLREMCEEQENPVWTKARVNRPPLDL